MSSHAQVIADQIEQWQIEHEEDKYIPFIINHLIVKTIFQLKCLQIKRCRNENIVTCYGRSH